MANVKVHQNSEEKAPVAEAKPNQVVDAQGRVIKFRELNPLQESRLVLAVGSEAATNNVYMYTFAFPAAKVESIDGDEYACPSNQAQIDGMITILGKDGMDAVLSHFNEIAEAAIAAKDRQAAIKN
ncbi:hypothetical protein [Rahnella sp. ChDrAdgB13]|uniref:hypothetical protein n=1 Tax=Rahnella sp. ChDrAdgB13 TaxID=1850581 RepID=UPI001AD86DD2|nr:hypothetical protein [Rahnella sp. ChDrAdgB13]